MADDDNKIVIPVEVTGDEEARKKIESLGESIGESVRSINSKQAAAITDQKTAPEKEERDRGSKTPPNLEQEVLGETNEDVGKSAEAIRLFRESLHVFHPALHEAGIGVGELTALIRASTGGVIALAAAIGGLLVTALEKAGDEANVAANRLGTFSAGGPSPSGGREAFEGLQETGRKVNESPVALAGPFEQLLRINQNQPPGQQLGNADLREILENLVKGLQAEKLDPEKALAALTETLSDIREKGFITGDSLKALEGIGPRLASTLLQELNKKQPGSATFTDRQFLGAAQAAGGRIESDLQTTEAAYPRGFDEAWHRVKVAAEQLSVTSTGGHAIARSLDAFAGFLDTLNSAAKKIQRSRLEAQEKIDDRKGVYASTQARIESAFERTTPITQEGGEDVTDAAKKLRDAFLALHPTVEALKATTDSAQKTLQDFADKQKENAAVSADAAKKQAAINLKFEPEETKSALAKDRLNIQNADIHLAQAKINGLDAQKNREIAGLGPESARQSVESARTRYSQAFSRFLKSQGADTSAQDALDERDATSNAVDEAATALKRAQIEEKYSYLDEPKAKLAAEQAQTAIKSAELEKNDASLKRAKDEAGAPVTHELAQLRYAQASLDLERVQADLLQKILGVLSENDQKAEKDVEKLKEDAEPQPSKSKDDNGVRVIDRKSSQDETQSQGNKVKVLDRNSSQDDVQPQQQDQNKVRVLDRRSSNDNEQQPDQNVADLGNAETSFKSDLTSLGDAVASLAERIQGADISGTSGVAAAGGGYIRGPGTTTSDSINARLSDKEYVQPADATEHYGVAFMDAVKEKRLPRFALGGLFGSMSRSMALPAPPSLGFASGGLAQAPSSASSDMNHWGTIDMRTNHGDFKVATERDTMRHLSSSAQRAKRYSTGPKPNWYGGSS